MLCANKVDGPSGEADASYLWSLGLGEPHPVSALHGRGTGDMLDAVLEALPEAPEQSFGTAVGGPRRIALIGRPNVGKSSLLNKVAGEERVVVNEMAGTTRDPVDELIELGGVTWKFVDTAGIRKRVHLQQGADYYASLRTAAAVEKAELAVILIDASENISVQDQRIVTMAVEAGRAIVLAFNKWDTLDEERRYYLEREIETELGQVAWAPRVNVSARTGRHMEKLVPAIETALDGWETRVPTGRLNAFLGELVSAHPHPVRGGKQPRILFGTQAGTKPPRFVLFASGFIEAGYRRFIERRLREEFASRAPRSTSRCGCARSAARRRSSRRRPPAPQAPAARRRRAAPRCGGRPSPYVTSRGSRAPARTGRQRRRDMVHPGLLGPPQGADPLPLRLLLAAALPGAVRPRAVGAVVGPVRAGAVRGDPEGTEPQLLLAAAVTRQRAEGPDPLRVEGVVDRRCGRAADRLLARPCGRDGGVGGPAGRRGVVCVHVCPNDGSP